MGVYYQNRTYTQFQSHFVKSISVQKRRLKRDVFVRGGQSIGSIFVTYQEYR